MDNLPHELAMMVCKQVTIMQGETEVDFSTRLLNIYNLCFTNLKEKIAEGHQFNSESDDFTCQSC